MEAAPVTLSAALTVLADWYALDDQHVRALRLEIADVADELGVPPARVLDALVEVTRTGRYPDDQQLAAGVKKLLGRVEADRF